MLRTYRSLVPLLGMICLLLVVTVAPSEAAIQCDTIYEHVDAWTDGDSEDGDEVMTLYAHGTADSGGQQCAVSVRTYMLDPNNTEIASAYDSGSGFAESTAVVYRTPSNVVPGEHSANTEAWSINQHYGCSRMLFTVWAGMRKYQKTQEYPDKCSYYTCITGACPSMAVKRATFFYSTNGNCPQYMQAFLMYITYDMPWIIPNVDFCELSLPMTVPNCG